MMAAMSSVEAALAVSPWEQAWDEEDENHLNQQPRKQPRKRQVAPLPIERVDGTAAIGTEVGWDEVDEEQLEQKLEQQVVKQKNATQRTALNLALPALTVALVETQLWTVNETEPVTDLIPQNNEDPGITHPTSFPTPSPQIENCKNRRHKGRIQYFRGCQGWVTSDDVSVDRSVNPLGKSWTEITNAIYIHKNDCQFVPCLGMDVTFCAQPDTQGKLKCVDVRQWLEPTKLTLDSYKEMKAGQRAVVGQLGTEPKSKSRKQVADSKSTAAPCVQLRRQVMRETSSTPQQIVQQRKVGRAALSRNNLEAAAPRELWPAAATTFYIQESASCNSSTVAGDMTSCSASVADVDSEFDVQEQPSVPDTKYKWADRPCYTKDPKDSLSRFCNAGVVDVKEQKQLQVSEDVAGDQFSVPDTWEDADLDALDKVLEAKHAGQAFHGAGCKDYDDMAVSCHANGVGIEEEKQLQIAEHNSQDQSLVPDAQENTDTKVLDEDPEAKMIHSRSTPGSRRLQQFLLALGPRFNLDFVVHHLGNDFDAIIECTSDIHALDSLVQAGMKPLLRNKLYTALVKEKEQRVTRQEVSVVSLADFLAEVGPEFDVTFVANTFGTDHFEEIITRFTHIDDFESLVVAGMKPLHKNKLYRALEVERTRRVRRS